MVLHSGDMPCPSNVLLHWHCFNGGALCLLHNVKILDEVTPANLENGAETALMREHDETDVSAEGDPRSQ